MLKHIGLPKITIIQPSPLHPGQTTLAGVTELASMSRRQFFFADPALPLIELVGGVNTWLCVASYTHG